MAVAFAGDGSEAVVDRPHEVLTGFGFARGTVDIMPDGRSFVLVEPATRGLVEVRVVTGWARESWRDTVPATCDR